MNIRLISPKPEDAWFWLKVRGQKSTQENNPIGILSEDKLCAQISESNSDISSKKPVHRYFIQAEANNYVGVISLKDINWKSGVAEIGYLIAEEFQDQGVATKAVALILQISFSAGIMKIKATTSVHNTASHKVLQKNGFEIEGCLQNEYLVQGRYHNVLVWAIQKRPPEIEVVNQPTETLKAFKRPYYAVIFSSQRSVSEQTKYEEIATRMGELSKKEPGFLGIESVRELNGFGITISYWESEDSIKNWKSNTEHLLAQEFGRRKWYKSFTTRICKVERDYDFERHV